MRLILAEDATLLREGLTRLLTDLGFIITASVPDAPALLAAVDADPPDVVITDIRMPPGFSDEGLVAALEIRHRHPQVAVLVLSQYLEAAYAERLLGGAGDSVGYLLKDRVNNITTLAEAVHRVARGEQVIDPDIIQTLIHRHRRGQPLNRLTDRERSVLALMAEGRSNHGIAQQLSLSTKTVETHVGAIMTKLAITESSEGNRRVLAVLRYLRS